MKNEFIKELTNIKLAQILMQYKDYEVTFADCYYDCPLNDVEIEIDHNYRIIIFR